MVDEGDDYYTQIESTVTTGTIISGDANHFDETFPAVPSMGEVGSNFSPPPTTFPVDVPGIHFDIDGNTFPPGPSISISPITPSIGDWGDYPPVPDYPAPSIPDYVEPDIVSITNGSENVHMVDDIGSPSTTNYFPITSENYDYTSLFQQNRSEVYMKFLMSIVNMTYPEYTGCGWSAINCGSVRVDSNTNAVIGQFPSGTEIQVCGDQISLADGEGNLISESVTILGLLFPYTDSFLSSITSSDFGINSELNINDFIKPTLGWSGLQNQCHPEQLPESLGTETSGTDEEMESELPAFCEGSNCEPDGSVSGEIEEIEPDESETACSDCSEGWGELGFVGYEKSKKIGDILKIELVENLQVSDHFEPVDLWVAIEDPKNNIWFVTDRIFEPFVKADSLTFEGAKPFKQFLQHSTSKHLVLEIQISEGMEGTYNFYAVYTTEGTNISNLLLNQRSNIAIAAINVESQTDDN